MKAILCNLAAIGCLLALFDLPSEFYKVLRFVVVAACIAVILEIQKAESSEKVKTWTSIGIGMLAVIYNPILPLRLERSEWFWFNCAGALAFLAIQHHRLVVAFFQQRKAQRNERKPSDKSGKLTRTEKLFVISMITFPSIFFFKDDSSGIASGLFVISMATGLAWLLIAFFDSILNEKKYKQEEVENKAFHEMVAQANRARTHEEKTQIIKNFFNRGKSGNSEASKDAIS